MKKILMSFMVMAVLASPVSFIEAKVKPVNRPMAMCKDGTYSYSKTHRGTCSHHKGVRVWYR